MRTYIILVVISLLSSWHGVRAESVNEIQLSCCSYHLDREAGFNEKNYGLFYGRHLSDSNFLIAGIFKNSKYRTSHVVGVGHTWPLVKYLTFSLTGGIVTGYPVGTIPAIMPTLTYHRIINLHIIPIYGGAVALSITAFRW